MSTPDPAAVDWIAVDWGTSNLRAWAMSGQSDIAFAQSDAGMGSLSKDGFEPALLDLVAPWLSDGETPVFACGMVGSRQGWSEARYTAVPCAALNDSLTQAPTKDPRLKVWIVPGLKQDSPADVMRGEETQIAGFLRLNPKFDGVLCLPGTHSKWVHISAEEVVSFQTFMTGELYATLRDHSVLRHGLGDGAGWDDDAFADALNEAISRPERLAARLFSLRAEGLLNDLGAASANARLSGLLIGAEMGAARPYWLGQNVAVIGSGAVTTPYIAALSAQGLSPIACDGSAMTRSGLIAAREHYAKVSS